MRTDSCKLFVITATARDGRRSQFAAVADCSAEAKDYVRQEYDVRDRSLEVFEYHRKCVFLPAQAPEQEAPAPAARR